MIRRNFFIREDQDTFLRNSQGNDSEIVRLAIDKYRSQQEKEKTTESPSESRGSIKSFGEGF